MKLLGLIAQKSKRVPEIILSTLSRLGWLVTLILILLFALSLRLIFFTGVLDWDVFEYAYYAYDASEGHIQFSPVPRDIQFRIALYLPLAFLYSLLGVSEFSTVIYVLVVSLLGIVFVYGIGRIQANESAGIIAALIWAAFPLNVFLSTLFGPDAIVATFSTGSVFFLLWANKLKGKKALVCLLLGLIFAVLGVFVKPLAAIVLFFGSILVLIKAFQIWQKPLKKWLARIPTFALNVGPIAGCFLLLIVVFMYFQTQSQPFLLLLFRGSRDLADLFIRGSTHETLRGPPILNSLVFLVAAPIFILSSAGLVTRRLHGSVLPLVWAAVMFLYFEWGSQSTNLTVYSPLVAVTNDRNVLFLFPPFAVLVGIFFAQWIKASQARWLTILSLVTILPLAWLQRKSQFEGWVQDLISLAVAIALIGLFLVVRYLNENPGKFTRPVLLVWLVIVLVAFLYPTPPLHISAEYWQEQFGYRRAIKQAVDFLFENPDYPLLVLSGNNADELSFLSGFEFGHTPYGVEQSNSRIMVVPDPKPWEGSAYVYLRDEINWFQPVPSDWWKVAEFDPGSGRPLLIYRHLSPEDAANELEAARRALETDQTIASLDRLLAAGVNAGDVHAAYTAWILLNRASAGEYSLDLISRIVIASFYQNRLPLNTNLLAPELVGDFESYQVDPALWGSLSYGSRGKGKTLSINIRDDLGGSFGIYKYVTLEPDSLYIFTIDVHSTAAIDLLRVNGGNIPDTHDYSSAYGEWEEQTIVFITPSWEEGQKLRLDLITVNKSGIVEVSQPRLYRVEFVKP